MIKRLLKAVNWFQKQLMAGATAAVIICLTASMSYAQITVTGTVRTSEDGSVLPTVTIAEKGTSNGTISDFDGKFRIQVKNTEAVLVFSFIGYKTQEVPVGNLKEVNVTMEPTVESLSEVVVVGYGTQKKGSLTGAVATANVDQVQKIPGGDISKMLSGQVSGVTVNSSSGAPGSTPQILIRGLSSITSSSPLVIIDGIPGDISYINPADIETINVLKDASAATIYGSRASNGVIIINTKKGKKGEPVVSLKMYSGIHNSSLGKIKMANRDEYNLIHTQALESNGEPLYPWITDATLPDSKWEDALFKQGMESKVDLSISGGSDYATYGFSAGYYKNSGTVLNTGNENISGRLNSEFKLLNDHLILTPSLAFYRTNIKSMYEPIGGGNGGWSEFMETAMQLPHKYIYDPSESFGFAVPPSGFPSGNPIALRSITDDKSQRDYLQGAINAEVKFTKSFSYKFTYGTNINDLYNYYHIPAYNFGNQAQLENTFLSEERGRSNQWVVNHLLTYNKSVKQHNYDALVGFSREKYEWRSTGGSNRIMPSNDLTTLGAGIGDRNSWGDRYANALQSYFSRLNYDYGKKYMVQASVRYDGSSRFSEKNRYGLFYSFSAGWAVHNESFFKSDWINELKPRFSYGTMGNQNIGDFQYLDLITSGTRGLNYPLGSPNILQPISIGAITVNSAAYNIKWEESAVTNLGVDMAFLNNKLSVSLDYFRTLTKDMLVVIPRPYSSGFNEFPRTNGGTMENRGWELTTRYRENVGDFRYDFSLNLSHSRNELTKLGSAGEYFIDGYVDYENNPTTKTEVGGEVGRFYMFRVLGIFQSQEEIEAYGAQPDAQPGDLIFEDVTPDGVINDDDKVYVGSPLPKLSYGLNANVGYKRFDLSLFFEGSHGNKMYNGFRMMMFRSAYINNTVSDLADAWTETNTDTDIFRNTSVDANYNLRVSDYFLEDASYLRLKNIQLSYTLDPKWFSSVKIKGMRVYVGSTNLLTITKYKGVDPALINEGVFSRGVDRGFYPLTRSVYFGINFDL